MRKIIFLFLIVSVFTSYRTQAQQGTKERIKVHSKALEGNLVNDPADRDVTVYLPPSYSSNPDDRYPVLYMLHGFTDDDSKWFGWEKHWIDLKEVIDQAFAEGLSKEMIVVMPNGRAMKDDRAKCIEAGANDYCSKPIDMAKLTSLMRVWLHK